MEILFEIIFEIIFEGILYLGTRRNVPLVLRVLFAVIVVGVYLGIIGLMLYIGLKANNFVVMLLALALAIIIALGAYRKYEELKK